MSKIHLARLHSHPSFGSLFFSRRASRRSSIRTAGHQKQYRPQSKVSRLSFPSPEPWSVPRKRLAALGAIATFVIGLYVTNSYVRGLRKETAASQIPNDVSDRYNQIAQDFDSDVGFIEALYGYGWLRSWITGEACGNVLEVSAGTGRNTKYYNLKKCTSVTMIDQSSEMVNIAKEKFQKEHPMYKKCRFIAQSALDPIESPPGGFDTVLQTMGICSVGDSVRLLRQLGSLVNPDRGRILLLEHGRSHYDWLNSWLDSSAPGHADRYGCWWNKDIGKIVEESGLEVVCLKRYHLGTTWWIELRPTKSKVTAPSP